jgi:hypothetical protein
MIMWLIVSARYLYSKLRCGEKLRLYKSSASHNMHSWILVHTDEFYQQQLLLWFLTINFLFPSLPHHLLKFYCNEVLLPLCFYLSIQLFIHISTELWMQILLCCIIIIIYLVVPLVLDFTIHNSFKLNPFAMPLC